ncbi:MAG: hypothetical protein EPN21_19500 [Methylococcaceae bacterium]|nr:MAG: hypothetical protein EPN21_19500 [Methylococcaceae bacterium]
MELGIASGNAKAAFNTRSKLNRQWWPGSMPIQGARAGPDAFHKKGGIASWGFRLNQVAIDQ